VGQENSISALYDDTIDSDAYWDLPNEDEPVEGSSLVVMPLFEPEFHLVGYMKRSGRQIETVSVPVQGLLDAVEKGPGCDTGNDFFWKSGQLFCVGDEDIFGFGDEDVLEDEED
jgi:hypothetical protein